MDQRPVLLIQRDSSGNRSGWGLEVAVQGWEELSRVAAFERVSCLVVALQRVIKVLHVCNDVERDYLPVFFEA